MKNDKKWKQYYCQAETTIYCESLFNI